MANFCVPPRLAKVMLLSSVFNPRLSAYNTFVCVQPAFSTFELLTVTYSYLYLLIVAFAAFATKVRAKISPAHSAFICELLRIAPKNGCMLLKIASNAGFVGNSQEFWEI